MLKFFHPFSIGVKINRENNLALGLKADKHLQSYLDKTLVRKMRRNVEKDEKLSRNDEILYVLSLAEDKVLEKGEICEMEKGEKGKIYTPDYK